MKKGILVVLALIMVLGLVGCGGINGIILSTNTCEIVQDETLNLSYTVIPTDANTDKLIWISSDENVATIDKTGKITAVSVGQTSITVSNGKEVFATCSVTVLEKPAYDRLAENEKTFVDCFLSNVSAFKDPKSVEVEGITFIPDNEGDFEDFWVVKVSAKNSFGGTVSAVYYLSHSHGFSEAQTFTYHDGEYNLELINKAIAEKR